MNDKRIQEALKMIDEQIMVSPVNYTELEDLRKALMFKIYFIEQIQVQQVAA